jgi:hypothetical protein
MRSILFRVILAASAALTAACGSTDSFAPASRAASARAVFSNAAGVATLQRSVDQYVWLSCANGGAGETVRVTGDLRYDVQNTQDASGVYHLNIKSNTSDLTAVGLTSGAFFRGMMAERINSRAEDYLNSDLRITDLIRFVAPGSGEAYSLSVTSHIIVDQGDYVLWDESWSEVCR